MDKDVVVVYRRTRSREEPNWSVADTLILVNEIAAVNGDCSDTLSSYQKWNIIAENCTLLDVVRTSSQCRRKWESVQVIYRKIVEYEAQLSHDPYWTLEPQVREEFGLPATFDQELFKAVRNILGEKEHRADTDPENGPEDDIDATETDAAAKSGSKRRKEHGIPDEILMEVKRLSEPVPRKRRQQRNAPVKHLEEGNMALARCCLPDANDEASAAELQLRENAELIMSIVKRGAVSEKDVEGDSDNLRCRGDKLIACLGNIIDALSEPCFDPI